MSALFSLFKKEMLEISADRQSRRGGFVQGIVFTVILGIFTVKPELWRASDPKAIFYFAFLPGVASASVASDAFAGERERKTLETLLASPLRERTILAGKAAAALTFGLLVGALGLFVANVTLNVSGRAFVPSIALVAGALGASFASALLMGSIAIFVSMLVSVARAAQQIASITSILLLVIGVALWQAFHIETNWRTAFGAEATLALVGVVVLEIAANVFRRERFFKQR